MGARIAPWFRHARNRIVVDLKAKTPDLRQLPMTIADQSPFRRARPSGA
jgi:hypothetical protein